MAVIKVLEESELDQWDKFVFRHKNGSIYHTSWWQKIIRSTYGHHPLYIVLKDEEGHIVGGMPLFLIKGIFNSMRMTSLPCAQTCNPLFGSQPEYDEILKYLNYLIREYRCDYAEIRTTSEIELATKSYKTKIENYSIYLLDLERPLDEVRRSFHKSCVQRPIEKASRSGLELIEGNTEADLRDFYNLYLTMRKSYGLLPQPFTFFSALWTELHPRGHMDLWLAKYSGRIASSLLLLKFKERVTYEYGASLPDLLNTRPSHFLIWEAIKKAVMTGYKEFDFGRTSDDNLGLSDFKSRWGTKRRSLTYYLIYNGVAVKPARENLLARKIMSILVSSSPAWLCERTGQVLYKYLV